MRPQLGPRHDGRRSSRVPFRKEEARLSIRANGEDHLLFEFGGPAAFDPKRYPRR